MLIQDLSSIEEGDTEGLLKRFSLFIHSFILSFIHSLIHPSIHSTGYVLLAQ